MKIPAQYNVFIGIYLVLTIVLRGHRAHQEQEDSDGQDPHGHFDRWTRRWTC